MANKEVELLLSSCMPEVTTETKERIRTLGKSGVHWEEWVAMAKYHNVLPIVDRNITAAGVDVPAPVQEELRRSVQQYTRNNLFLMQQLLHIVKLFEDHNIPILSLKGPILGLTAYRHVTLRMSSDLDILVPEKELSKAKEVLCLHGYQESEKLSPMEEKAIRYGNCECSFYHQDTHIGIDLHWGIAPRYFAVDFDVDRIFADCKQLSIGTQKVATLSSEDLLLFLCIHGSKHLWIRLKWVCDVAFLLHTHKEMNWELVVAKAKELGCERMLHLGLFFASEHLGVQIPTQFQWVKKDKKIVVLAREARQSWINDKRLSDPSISNKERISYHLRMRESIKDRVKYCFRLVFDLNKKDIRFCSLPNWLYFLYYPLRPVRLAFKYVRRS